MEETEIESLREEVAALRLRLESVEAAAEKLRDGAAELDEAVLVERLTPFLPSEESGGGSSPGRAVVGLEPPDSLPPFAVFCETDSDSGRTPGGFYIHVPPGCVLLGGREVTIGDEDNEPDDDDCLPLDLGSDDSDATVYAHVRKEAEGSDYYVVFDKESVDEDADYTFVVAKFRGEDGPLRMCSSIVSIGGAAIGLSGCYEIVAFAEGEGGSQQTKHFANRYYEVSGVVREGPDGDPADYRGKFLALDVSSATAQLQGYTTFAALQTAMMDRSRVVIPLYKFTSAGNVACDMRHLPRADMWSTWNISNA